MAAAWRMNCHVCAVMPVLQESPWTAWKFIKAPCSTTLLVPTDHNECRGPTILGKRHTKVPVCSDVRLTFFFGFGFGLGLGFVVVVTGTVVVDPGVVVEVDATVVVVVGAVVVVVGAVEDDALTNFTGR